MRIEMRDEGEKGVEGYQKDHHHHHQERDHE
jgi:hypothetical protein